jgi:hypothetical protein
MQVSRLATRQFCLAEFEASGEQKVSSHSPTFACDTDPCSSSFWVCEKSDGVRVLMLIAWNDHQQKQDIFLVGSVSLRALYQDSDALPFRAQIDRKNTYRQINNLVFPHWNPQAGPGALCNSTIIDGELVCDIDRKTGEVRVSLLQQEISADRVSRSATSQTVCVRLPRVRSCELDEE